MKKTFFLVLALLIIISLLPIAAMAEAPAEVKVKFFNGTAPDFTLTISNGSTAFVVEDTNKELVKWTGSANPTDKFIKLEYASGTVKMTMNNVNVDLTGAGGYVCHGICYQAGDYKVDINLVGSNSMTHGQSASMKFDNTGDITISGSGSLSLTQTGSAAGAIWCAGGGKLTVKNTTMNFSINPTSASALLHAIFMAKGSVSIEGSKISSETQGGQLVYFGTTDLAAGRYTPDTDTTRKLSIKNSEITAKAGKAVFSSAASATIENSTLKITLTGSGGPAFSPAPTFVGDYTAIAGLAKNAEKPDKLNPYQESKLSSYTYIYAVPGIVQLLPTKPAPTVPEATEPDPIVPDTTVPEDIPPIATAPSATYPQATTPETIAPDTNYPSIIVPDASDSNNAYPEQALPNDNNSDIESEREESATIRKPKKSKINRAKEEDYEPGTLTIILIVLAVVAVGAAFGVLFYLKKKKAQ